MKIDPIWQIDVQQRVFRQLLNAFANPGDILDLHTLVNNTTAQRAVLATLMDGVTSLSDPHGQIMEMDWPLLQARQESSERARYVVVNGRRTPDFQPSLGSLESPEFGATLLIEVDRLGQGDLSLRLTGPGINGDQKLNLSGLHPDWMMQRADWVSSFPLGVDLLLSDAHHIVALPRTTRIEISGESQT